MDHKFIKQVEIGDNFSGTYFLEQVNEKTARTGTKYTDLVLRDRSGSVPCRHWGTLDQIKKGEFINVVATVEDYKGQQQIIINSIEAVEKPEDMSSFVNVSVTKDKDIEKLNGIIKKISELSKEVGNPLCEKLVQHFFEGESLDNFCEKPYGILPYYGRIGGLLAHTVRATVLAFDISKPYNLSAKEKLVMLTSGLLHAVGAVDAYTVENFVPVETTTGTLIGRTPLSLLAVDTAVKKLMEVHEIDDSQDKLEMRIRHAIAACDYASGIKPMTKEAVILFEACKSDYNVVEALDFMAQDTSQDQFTAFDPTLKRRYYKG